MKSIYSKIALALSALMLLSSCATAGDPYGDVLTQKSTQAGRLQLTMSTKYSVYLDGFEQAVEAKFPSLDLVLVGNHTANYSDEYAEQLANDDLTDIVLTWPLDSAARDCKERLVDLSGMEFTSRYSISMLNSAASDGVLYYLPGPTQVRGILFNKTMFDEHGWAVPTDFDSFVSLCQQIEATGMRSLQLSFWNKEVLRYAFYGFGYTQSFSTPAAEELINLYNQGQGSMGDFALPAIQTFQQLVEAGIFRPEDLEVRYPIREKMFYERRCAMISEGIAIIPAARRAGNNDELAVMPFFGPDGGSWGQLIPLQYIGLNNNLTKSGNEKKYKLALQVMDFISTPEGQLALANGDTSMISSLSNSPAPDAPELRYMRETIQAGRCVMFPELTNVGNALYNGLADMLRGEMDAQQLVDLVDDENNHPKLHDKSPIIGTATETFTLSEVGSYVTDVLRAQAGSDLALFLDNGKDGTYNARGISAKLYKGEILESDVTKRVLPVLQHGEKGYLNIATMTGENLQKALENTLADGDWFYYASGLQMEYNPTAAVGSRLGKLTDASGAAIDPARQYTVAIMEGTVDEAYITSLETTEKLVSDLVIGDIKAKGIITPTRDKRLKFLQ